MQIASEMLMIYHNDDIDDDHGDGNHDDDHGGDDHDHGHDVHDMKGV